MKGLQKIKNRSTICDPAIPLLDVYPKEMKTGYQIYMYTPMFIAALFTKAKIWKQPKCLSTDEWIKEMFYTYIYIYIKHVMKYYIYNGYYIHIIYA